MPSRGALARSCPGTVVLWLLLAATLAACGPDTAPTDSATAAPGIETAAVGPDAAHGGPLGSRAAGAKTGRVRAGTGESPDELDESGAPLMTREEAERYVAAWNAIDGESADGPRERKRLEDEVVARGAAAIPGLIAAFRASPAHEETREAIEAVLHRLGPAAFLALTNCLDLTNEDAREWIESVLGDGVVVWRSTPQGEEICRALVAAAARTPGFEAWSTIANARPAARVVAADIARLWLAGDGGVDSQDVEALGGDAAAAVPDLVKWWTENDAVRRETAKAGAPAAEPGEEEQSDGASHAHQERSEEVVSILAAIGSADPSVLPLLVRALDEGDATTRRDVCRILATWGDAAATVADRLVPLLADEATRDAAAAALAGMPSVAPRLLVAVLEASSGGVNGGRGESVDRMLKLWMERPDAASRFARDSVTLSGPAAVAGLFVVWGISGGGSEAMARSLLTHSDPTARTAAAEHLAEQLPGQFPEEVEPLLADADPDVRLAVIDAFSNSGALPAARVRELVQPFRTSADPDVRARVLSALCGANAVTRDDLALCVAALSDGGARDDALRALARIDGPLPGLPSEVLAALAAGCVRAWGDRTAEFGVFERISGGTDALLASVTKHFGAVDEETGLPDWWIRGRAFEMVALLGPRAETLRAALVASRPPPESDDESTWRIYGGEEALAALAGDADAFVSGMTTLYEADLAILRRLGDRGRLAIALFAGGEPNEDDFPELLETLRGDDGMAAAVREASRIRAGDGHSVTRRAGAVRLSSLLPVAEARALVVRLAGDEAASVREVVAQLLAERALDEPGAVPVEALAALLSNADASNANARMHAALAAYRLGPAASTCTAALRRLAAAPDAPVGMAAVMALRRVAGEEATATEAVRKWIARAAEEAESSFLGSTRDPDVLWIVVGDFLAEVPVAAADVAVLARLARASCRGASGVAALRGLERAGRAAAPAVDQIRAALAHIEPEERSGGHWWGRDVRVPVDFVRAAARVLAAIGPAARAAIPDLRRCAAVRSDAAREIGDAIARIEASR